jgi:hypothetical protein
MGVADCRALEQAQSDADARSSPAETNVDLSLAASGRHWVNRIAGVSRCFIGPHCITRTLRDGVHEVVAG